MIINGVGYVFIALFALVCFIPFYLVVTASFTDNSALIREGYPLIPKVENLSTMAYQLCLSNPKQILLAYATTAGVTIVGTTLSVFLSTMTGYALSRKDFVWRNPIAFYFFFTTLFNGGLVPSYILCTKYLHLRNNYLALILPSLFSVFNMIISKAFMSDIPSAITDSAKIDGAGDFKIYRKLILPLSKPLVATLVLFSALGFWNDWYNCMLYIDNKNMFNLQYMLQNMLNSMQSMQEMFEQSGLPMTNLPLQTTKMAMTVIATGPIILLYPFVQKYFVKGLTVGAVKG